MTKNVYRSLIDSCLISFGYDFEEFSYRIGVSAQQLERELDEGIVSADLLFRLLRMDGISLDLFSGYVSSEVIREAELLDAEELKFEIEQEEYAKNIFQHPLFSDLAELSTSEKVIGFRKRLGVYSLRILFDANFFGANRSKNQNTMIDPSHTYNYRMILGRNVVLLSLLQLMNKKKSGFDENKIRTEYCRIYDFFLSENKSRSGFYVAMISTAPDDLFISGAYRVGGKIVILINESAVELREQDSEGSEFCWKCVHREMYMVSEGCYGFSSDECNSDIERKALDYANKCRSF